MLSSQQFVLRWIEYAATGAMLLWIAQAAMHRLRQPADRITLVLITMVVTAGVPLLACVASLPSIHLGIFRSQDRQPDAVAMAIPPAPAEPNQTRPSALNRQEPPTPSVATSAQPGGPLGQRGIQAAPAAPSMGFDPWRLATIGLVLSYALAVGFFLCERFVGATRLRRIVASGRPADGAVQRVWMRLTEGRGGRTRVIISREITVPLAYGWLRPTVVIPASLVTGDPAALRFCLLHEWTHISQGDLQAWRLTWVCQFLLWFQPQFWTLRRELRVCQDLLADHRAAGEGRDRVEYSELLMSFAQRPIKRSIVGTIAYLDRSSQLSRRIKMLLDSTLSLRSRSPRALYLAAGALAVACGLSLGLIRLDSARASGDEQTAKAEAPRNGGISQNSAQRPNISQGPHNARGPHSETHPQPEMKTVRGQVVDAAGAPVGGARLWLPLRFEPRRVAQATADDSGRFEFKFPAAWVSPQVTGSGWTVWASAPGYSIATRSAFQEVRGKSEQELTIQLPPAASTRFNVLTPDGAPLAGVLVRPQNYKTTVAYEGVPEEMFSLVSSTTNSAGVATLLGVEPTPLFSVQLEHEKYGKQTTRVDRDQAEPVREIVLREPGRIEGKLTGERPEWLRGVRIAFVTDNEDATTQGEAQVVTGEDGGFTVPAIASGGPLHTYVLVDHSLPVRPRLNDDLYVTSAQTLEIEIPFEPAVRAHGKVVSKSSGAPVPKAEISLGYGGYRQSEQVVTDEQGHYEGLVLAGPVRTQIIAMPGEYVQLGTPWAESTEVPQGSKEFELPTIEVAGTRKVSGQLIDGKDQPLAATELMSVDSGRRYGHATTDAEGHFTISLPDGLETRFEVYSDARGQEPTTVVRNDPLVLRYVAGTQKQE